jgi:hypothetical protein
MRLSTTQRRALFLVALVGGMALGPALGAAGGSFISSLFPVASSGTVSFQTNSNLTVNYETNGADLAGGDRFPNDNEVSIASSRGNITVSGADGNVTVEDPTGTWTNTSLTDVSNTIGFYPEDKREILVTGETEELDWRDYRVNNGQADVYYRGSSGQTELTFFDLPADEDVALVDVNSNEVLGTGTTAPSGVVSFQAPNSQHTAALRASDDGPTFSNASPTQPVTDDPVTLSVDVDDADFSGGDNVTVTLSHDGNQVKQTDITSAQTVSYTLNSVTAGSHNWTVTAEDSFGNSNSQSYSYGVPDTLYIRNETNASELVDSPTEVQVTFFAENGSVYTRQTTTGTIDMRGLPATEDFYVQANADGYRDRTVYLESLIEQQTVYLLNESVSSATIVFELDDSTGRFPASETTLFVEKPINVSGSTQYRVIASDQFGAANEIVTELENNQRYRLRVESPDGETRILGNYRTAGDARAVLPIGQVSVGNAPEEGAAFDAELIEQNGQPAVRIVYRDTAAATTDLRLEIHEMNDPTTVIRANTSESGPFGVYSETYQLPAPYNASSSLSVQYHANRTNAADTGDTVNIGEINSLSFGNLDGNVLSLAGWVGLVAVAGFTAPISGALGAMATVIFASFLAIAGILSIPGALLGLAGATAVLFAFGGRD